MRLHVKMASGTNLLNQVHRTTHFENSVNVCTSTIPAVWVVIGVTPISNQKTQRLEIQRQYKRTGKYSSLPLTSNQDTWEEDKL